MAFEKHICSLHISCSSMVNKCKLCKGSLVFHGCAVMCGLYVDCLRIAVEHLYAVWRHISSGAYGSSVKCMHTSACGHIIDCSEFIRGIYTDIVV